jgi:tetratricopeptide (TPR) repeat protein
MSNPQETPVSLISSGDRWLELVEQGGKTFAQRRFAQAEVIFLEALRLAEQFGESDNRLTITLNNLAAAYHSQGKYAMADTEYRRALKLNQSIHGPKSVPVACNLHNLAVTHCAKFEYAEAEPLYIEAIAIKEKELGANDLELISVLNNYSQMLFRLNREDEAKAIEERIRQINNQGK